MSNSETGDKAGSNLEGGLRSMLEGLRYSWPPCAQVLSVAGFFALLLLFLGWEGFILEGERASFLPAGPCLFNDGNKPRMRHV